MGAAANIGSGSLTPSRGGMGGMMSGMGGQSPNLPQSGGFGGGQMAGGFGGGFGRPLAAMGVPQQEGFGGGGPQWGMGGMSQMGNAGQGNQMSLGGFGSMVNGGFGRPLAAMGIGDGQFIGGMPQFGRGMPFGGGMMAQQSPINQGINQLAAAPANPATKPYPLLYSGGMFY